MYCLFSYHNSPYLGFIEDNCITRIRSLRSTANLNTPVQLRRKSDGTFPNVHFIIEDLDSTADAFYAEHPELLV